MITTVLKKVFGTKHDREMKRLWPRVEAINSLEAKYKNMADDRLIAQTGLLKEKLEKGASVDDIHNDAFAVCREAAIRVLGMRHYDVQLIGGMTLNSGSIAEMKTGEGKTLVATLPVYLNALTGRGVHVVTVNDYLASRDAEWMGQLYKFLGMSVGVIKHELADFQRKEAYGCDITYATNNELGFDYLRDNMKFSLDDYVQRELHYAIVDECDSILIDEARTPLIISGPAEDYTEKYIEINKIIPHLKHELHFTSEEKNKTVSLTDEGNTKVEELLGIENLYDAAHIDTVHHVYQALKAHHMYRKDVDYMIVDKEIVIVDEFTGRLMEGRRWSEGLHQAVEAKENVPVKSENQTLASITFQNYFRMYSKLSGMTGTADTEAVEFKKIYDLDVSVIPTNKPIARIDRDDVVYKSDNAKYNAIVNDIKSRSEKGQPILVGTASIEKSEVISRALGKAGIKHEVLNAKHHEREADIVAQAGRKGAITIATNMAGRGTDIVLGGNSANLAKQVNPDEESSEYKDAFKKFETECEAEKKEVLSAGGLYIIGTERHESRRIDNQLRGRSGRQGDPGESMFYLSLEDDLMRRFGGDRLGKIMNTLNVPEDEPITHKMVSRSIEGAQRKVEGHNFDIRKHLLEYDDVMNQQRHAIYGLRREILEGGEVSSKVLEMLGDVTSDLLDDFAGIDTKREHWDLDALRTGIEKQFGLRILAEDLDKPDADALTEVVQKGVQEVYNHQKTHMGDLFEEVQKSLLLGAIDHWWKEHLQRIDKLRDWVSLKAYAQKDPLLEYKKEAFNMYHEMQKTIRKDVIEKLCKIQLVREGEASNDDGQIQEEEAALIEALKPKEQQNLQYHGGGAPEEEGAMAGPNGRGGSSSQGGNRAQRRKQKRRRIKR